MIDKFLSAEEEYGLLEDSMQEFKYWFFIRDKVYHKIIGARHQSKSNGPFSRVCKKIDAMAGSNYLIATNSNVQISTIVHLIKNVVFPKYLHPEKKDILIFTAPRRTLESGLYYNIYTDFIQDLFPGRCSTAEFADVLLHLRPAYSNPIYEMDRLDVIPFIMGEILKIVNKSNRRDFIKKGKYISKMLFEKLGKQIDANEIANLIETRYYWYKYKKNAIKKFILKTNPKVIIEVCSYGRNALIVNEVASELKIPTVELQHGNMGFGHIAYNYKVKRSYVNLPQYMCVFGEYWKRTMRFPIEEEKVVVTGFPEFEKERKRYGNKHLKKSIVVLSQHIYTTELVTLTKQIAVLLGDDYKIYYKLHPAEYNHSASIADEFVDNSNVQVVDGSGRQLYDLFSECSVQIGAFTTCLFEGLGCGLQTIIVDIRNSIKRVETLIENKYAMKASNAEECVKLIKKRYQVSDNKKINDFFVADSVKRHKDFIERFL